MPEFVMLMSRPGSEDHIRTEADLDTPGRDWPLLCEELGKGSVSFLGFRESAKVILGVQGMKGPCERIPRAEGC